MTVEQITDKIEKNLEWYANALEDPGNAKYKRHIEFAMTALNHILEFIGTGGKKST